VDENVDRAKFGWLWLAFPRLGFRVPTALLVWVGGRWPEVLALLVAGFVHWVSI